MKKTLFFIAAIIWTACSSDHVQEVSLLDKGRILIIEATKGQADTRGLALDGNTLNAIWSKDDVVTVLSASGSVLGTLKPETTGSSSTTLKSTGPISVSAGDNLTLVFPRTDRDYTGQIGTLENIAKYYDYATASVTVQDINGSSASTTQATFENKQAIVRFTLIDDNNQPINANSLTIAANGLLQKESTTGQQTTGSITITQTANPATNVFYAALSGVENSIITLIANIRDVDNPSKTTYIANSCYSYTKPNVTFTNNKFYSVNVKMNRDLMRSTPLTLECFDETCTSENKITCDVTVTDYSDLEYYQSDKKEWKTYTSETSIQLFNGEWVSFRGTNATQGADDYMNIKCSGKCYVYGNVMSLLDKDNFATMVDLPYDHTFQNLFKGNDCIFHDSGKDLVLPATKLISHCYYQMFYNCVNLSSIKCLATEFPEDEDEKETVCFQWLVGAGTSFEGTCTFVRAEGTIWPEGPDGIPSDWKVEPPYDEEE